MALLDDITKNVDLRGLDELELSRYLYIELGKRVSFSTKFQNSGAIGFANMMHTTVDIRTFTGKEVNCIMWSQLYSQLLSSFGIRNKIVDMGHQFVEFHANGKKMVADATYGGYTDLARIHNSDDTACFGLSLYQTMDKSINAPMYDPEFDKVLKGVDTKIGYNNEMHKDLVEFKDLIIKIRSGSLDINSFVAGEGSDTLKKLELLFAKAGVVDLGYYEAKDFLYSLERMLLTGEELQNVKGKEIKRTNRDGSVDIKEVISLQEDNGFKYFLLSPNEPVKEVSPEDIIKLSYKGYGKDEREVIPGIVFPTNFVPGKKIGLKTYIAEKVSDFKIFKNPNVNTNVR